MSTWTKLCTAGEFKTLVTDLRAVADFPRGFVVKFVRVQHEDMPDANGDTDKSGRTFTIRINAGLSKDHVADILVHEAAHVLTWRPYTPLSEDHGPQWGVEYARLYQCFHHCR